jgi:predicted GNAT family acetyltransferase
MTVTDNPAQSRFELQDGDRVVGWVDYLPAGPSVIIAHTEIEDGHEGQGLGSVLVRGVLDQLSAAGKTVIPTCPFTAAFIHRHPEYAGVVDPSLRDQFS